MTFRNHARPSGRSGPEPRNSRDTIRVASVFEAPLTIGVVLKWSFLTAVVVWAANNDNGLALSGTAPSGVALAELLRWKAKVGPPAVVLGLGCKQSPGLGHDRARPPWPRTTGIYLYLSGKGSLPLKTLKADAYGLNI